MTKENHLNLLDNPLIFQVPPALFTKKEERKLLFLLSPCYPL